MLVGRIGRQGAGAAQLWWSAAPPGCGPADGQNCTRQKGLDRASGVTFSLALGV